MKGSLITILHWELAVSQSSTDSRAVAFIIVHSLRYHANQGEDVIGEPKDFNTDERVKKLLADKERLK
jgi:hypothetical protein